MYKITKDKKNRFRLYKQFLGLFWRKQPAYRFDNLHENIDEKQYFFLREISAKEAMYQCIAADKKAEEVRIRKSETNYYDNTGKLSV